MDATRASGERLSPIIVVGYPKSGSTWIVRLTAELVGGPVAGFWGHPDAQEMAMEGAERISPYRCYKAHQPFPELGVNVDEPDAPKVIYVVRDPRDVAVSGAHYFAFKQQIRQHAWLRVVAWLLRQLGWSRRDIARRLFSLDQRLAFMVSSVLQGASCNEGWRRLPWVEHVAGYRRPGVLLVRYEDMLTAPDRECSRILAHVGLEAQATSIRTALSRHNFKSTKERFIQAGKTEHAEFLRSGRAGEWRNCLSSAQQAWFQQHVGECLRQLNYAVE